MEHVNFKYITLKNESLQKMFVEKQLALKQAALESGRGSEVYLAKRKEHQIAFAAKVRSLLVPRAA